GAQLTNVVKYLVERLRRQPKNLGLAGKRVQQLRNFISRRRANLAEVLRQDQIGGKFAQKLLVDTIEALFVAQPFTNGSVDLLLAHIFHRQNAADDDRLSLYLLRIITLMCNAHELVRQS